MKHNIALLITLLLAEDPTERRKRKVIWIRKP